MPKLFGITKVKNEEHIIKDTLDNWSQFCDEIYVYDDCSTDRTVEICKTHPKVKEVFEGTEWDKNRERAEWVTRQIALTMAQRNAKWDDWFCYFDADEHLYDFDGVEGDAVACKLYDIYITEEDVDKSYKEREWIGPEYRLIPFFFKNSPALQYHLPDQRAITLDPNAKTIIKGSIKHFGKGFSVKHWEDTCDYYIAYWPKYRRKWQKRKGKAIHALSDFNNKLIKWENRNEGFLLAE